MRDDQNPEDPTDGGHHGQQGGSTKPPVDPPTAAPPGGTGATRALLIAAGFATVGALLAFLVACMGQDSAGTVELGLLLAVLALVLDAVSSQTLGGHVGAGSDPTKPPVSPPRVAGLFQVTAATILTALGLLAVMLECALEQNHGSAKVGLLLLLLAAVADFIAAYQASSGSSSGG